MKIAIIGAGLAGTSCAYLLKEYGFNCIVYESFSALASQGSGNNLGLYNPRLCAEYTPEAELYKTAFDFALETFPKLDKSINWNPCGALHLMTEEKRKIRYNKMVNSWGWDEGMMKIVSAKEASAIAGIPIDYDALYLPQSGAVSPKNLCKAYAQNIDIRYGHPISNLSDIDADIIILANGAGSNQFPEAAHLPLGTVRGQITEIKATKAAAQLKTALCYSGYTAPIQNGVQHIGSTFQRWLDHTNILEDDDEANIEKLYKNVPALAGDYEIDNHRAGLRITAPDHVPIIGKVSERLYVSTAHGSHGILTSLLGAKIITNMIADKSLPVSERVINKLNPNRFKVETDIQ